MARPTDEQMKARLMEELRNRNGYSGNIRLLGALGWSEDEYWRVRNKLIDEGVLVKGQGKGGTVRIVEEVEEAPTTTTDVVVERVVTTVVAPMAFVREESLYEPCLATLQHFWFPERQIPELHIEITARQGRRNTGGTWTRPDIAALSARTFRYVPGRHLDVWTFEVKSADQLDVVGVFEAAAHSRSATRSYCLFQVEGARGEITEAVLRRAQDEARRFGLGLIIFSDPTDYSTWETLVEATRRDPAPELLDEFIANQISENGRDKLLRWTK
jgi:hypothetical protein